MARKLSHPCPFCQRVSETNAALLRHMASAHKRFMRQLIEHGGPPSAIKRGGPARKRKPA